MNVLNLAGFFAMSRRHSHLIWSLRRIQVTNKHGIWKIEAKVLEELTSCKIANEFCLAKRITQKNVICKGVIFSCQEQKEGFRINRGRGLKTLVS